MCSLGKAAIGRQTAKVGKVRLVAFEGYESNVRFGLAPVANTLDIDGGIVHKAPTTHPKPNPH